MAENAEHRREALFVRIVRRLANSRELTLFVLVVALAVGDERRLPQQLPDRPQHARRAAQPRAGRHPGLRHDAADDRRHVRPVGRIDAGLCRRLGRRRRGLVGLAGRSGASLVGILVGALCGLVNGLIVTRIGINALIATLGTLTIYRSLTYVTAGTGVTPITDAFAAYGRAADPLLRIQSPFWAMLVLVLIGGWLVARTRFFRQFYFIGGNPRAAQLSGIRVDRLILIGFVIMGALAGLAGVLGAARLNSAVVNAGVGIELKVITATVLGGASLKGGEGTILGGILGVLFIALIENAMIINAVGVFWQGLVVGLVLLFAVSLDRFKSSGRG